LKKILTRRVVKKVGYCTNKNWYIREVSGKKGLGELFDL